MERTGSCQRGRGDGMREGKGIRQRTYMHGTWTWTTEWGLPEGGGPGWKCAKREKVGTTKKA